MNTQSKNKGYIKKLLKIILSYKKYVFFYLIILFLSVIIAVICPVIIGNAIDIIAEGWQDSNSSINFNELLFVLIIAIIIYVILFVIQFLLEVLESYYSQYFTYDVRLMLFKKIAKLPFSYFETNQAGDLLSLFVNDSINFCNYYIAALGNILTSVLTILSIFVAMLVLNPILTLFVGVVNAIFYITLVIMFTVAQKYYDKQQNQTAKLNAYIEESLSGFELIKSYNNEENTYKHFQNYNNSLNKSGIKASILNMINFIISNFAFYITFFVITVFGLLLVNFGYLTIGGIQVFLMYITACKNPIDRLINISSSVQRLFASAKRIFSFIDEYEVSYDGIIDDDEQKNDKMLTNNNNKYILEIDDVSFSYNKDKQVLNNINIVMRKGEKLAIIGPTGSGKTTLAKLLVSLYKPDSGKIKINGYDITDIREKEVRNKVGMVSQQDWIFDLSVYDNIAFGEVELDKKKVIDTAKKVGADSFIKNLSQQYDTRLNFESENISEGQKQLISIARALYSDKDIIIFDEATSCLDGDVEQILMDLYDNAFKHKTIITIAHRLSTIKNSDEIIVLKDGQIFERGSHWELMKKDGYYTNVVNG